MTNEASMRVLASMIRADATASSGSGARQPVVDLDTGLRECWRCGSGRCGHGGGRVADRPARLGQPGRRGGANVDRATSFGSVLTEAGDRATESPRYSWLALAPTVLVLAPCCRRG